MTETTFAPLSLEGWYALHQFFRLPGPELDDRDADARADGAGALADLFAGWSEDADGEGWSGLYRVVGGGIDLMAIHFRPTLDELAGAESALLRGPAAEELIPAGDYLSVVELGLYGETARLLERAREEGVEVGSPEWKEMAAELLEEQRSKKYVRGRLRPLQPDGMPYACFYPMDKRRSPGQNWYTLPLEERARLMHEHGQTGRQYAGRISQIICGSVGLDDWEWGVTLFAGDPVDFKEVVTDMRYDVASSVYAEFGSFFVGRRLAVDEIRETLARP